MTTLDDLSNTLNDLSWSNGLVVKALHSQSRGPVFKTTGCLQGWIDSALHPSKGDKMSTRNIWELKGKK